MMKWYLLFSFCALFCMLGVFGCGEKQRPSDTGNGITATDVSIKDLLHHRFELVSVDGKPMKKKGEQILTIEFNEGFRVAGQICNRFMGQGELNKGSLQVRQIAATRMICPNQELTTLEHDLFKMLDQGMNIRLKGTTLYLSRDDRELVYERNDWRL